MIAPMPPAGFLAATCLDWIAGDPYSMPHPVRLIGKAISTGEQWVRRPDSPAREVARGAALTGVIVGASWTAAKLAAREGGALPFLLQRLHEVAMGLETRQTVGDGLLHGNPLGALQRRGIIRCRFVLTLRGSLPPPLKAQIVQVTRPRPPHSHQTSCKQGN